MNLIDNLEPKPLKNKQLKSLLNELLIEDLDFFVEDFNLDVAFDAPKEEVVERVLEVYLEKIPQFFNLLTKSQLELVLNSVKQDVKCPNQLQDDCLIPYYLGIMFFVEKEDGKYLVIADELKNWIQETNLEPLIEKAEINSAFKQYLIGIINLYGLYPIKELIDVYAKQNQIIIQDEMTQYIQFLSSHERYYYVFNEAYIVHNELLPNLEYYLDEIERRQDLAYYPFTYDEIMRAGHVHYIESSSAQDKLYHYLKKKTKKQEDLFFLNHTCYLSAVSGASLQKVMDELSEYFEFHSLDDANEFVQLYTNLCNHCHQWLLKGHRPIEIGKVNQKKKVGRNDPCPCGSGKKYKQCCL